MFRFAQHHPVDAKGLFRQSVERDPTVRCILLMRWHLGQKRFDAIGLAQSLIAPASVVYTS